MASSKPRGRPPADGNYIMWTEPLVESLLRLRFEKYAQPVASARGTKSLRVAWANMAEELTQQNNGDVVSVEKCRNKLKALRNKWLAYQAGLASEPMCVALIGTYWGSGKGGALAHQSRPSPEHRKHVKKPRWTSSTSDAKGETDVKPLVLIAPAPVPPAAAPASTPATNSTPTLAEATAPAASTSTTAVEAGTGISTVNPTQLLGMGIQAVSQGFTDMASAAGGAARPKYNLSVENGDLSRLEELIDDRFAKVLERQEKQLRLTGVQNQLLAKLLATMRQG